MNFLTLAQTLRQETAVADSGPTDVTTASGDMKRLVDWIALAYREIQTLNPEWYFLRKRDTSLTTTGQTIALPADFAEPISLVLEDSGSKIQLDWLDRAAFDELYATEVFQTGRPTVWCIEDGYIKFNTVPDDAYALSLLYMRTPHVMVTNTDTPIIPERFQYIIVYRAMQHWGMFDVASEIVQRGTEGYNRILPELSASQLPKPKLPGTIA